MRIKMPAVRIAQGQLVTSLKFNAYLLFFFLSKYIYISEAGAKS